MTTRETPSAEVHVDEALVRRLLEAQMPDLADLELRPLASGWDNVMFRLGDDLTVRLPRRSAAAELVANEHRWLPVLAPRLPVSVPVPLRTGVAQASYPWAWTVCDWFAGAPAHLTALDEARSADTLAEFLTAMHVRAPADAPRNPWRGTSLSTRTDIVFDTLDRTGDVERRRRLEAVWPSLLAVAEHPGPAVWLHGDLHPSNIIVENGDIRAVIDFGDICSGDPASDLACAWMLFDTPARGRLRAGLAHVDDALWARGCGWAIALGIAIHANSSDKPEFAAAAIRGADRALEEVT